MSLATERLEHLTNHDVSSEQRARLLQVIAEGESNPTVVRERQYATTGALSDLIRLVGALEAGEDWSRLVTYARALFQRTKDLPSCQLLVRSLSETGRFKEVVDFLDAHDGLLARSEELRSTLAWTLYRLGDLNRCRQVLLRLQAHRDSAEDRRLTVNVALASGDWHSLAAFVEGEWTRRADRTAEELLHVGQIAQQLAFPRASALIVEAAAKGSDDPRVLTACYSSAVAAGWEDEATFAWLEKAAALSDASGPVQRVSLRTLVEGQPEWQRRDNEVWEQLNAGLVPLFAAASLMNRSVAECAMLPLLANSETLDPRRRTLLYSYSGARSVRLGMPDSIAIDPTALLIAGTFGLLTRILTAVDRVIVPHSTLGWLFEERGRIRFHQPTRVSDAREIRRLVDSGVLTEVEPTVPSDDALAREVGQELASLFAEASADWGSDPRPRRVVKSAPIHRLGSLMEEEADIGSYLGQVCGCLPVVDALARAGRLTSAEQRRASAFLSQHEIPWREGSAVAPGSVLYMDGVSLAYFQHLRLLSKFEASGFAVMILTTEIAECDRLIRYDALRSRASDVLDHIRETLHAGIASGKVRLAPMPENDGSTDGLIDHPAMDIVRIAELADAAVVDDRYFNQHSDMDHGGGALTPIWTTYDLLAALKLNAEEHADCLSRMRSASLAFVPVDCDELSALLARTGVRDGVLIESAELRAFRENVEVCRMSNGLRLPKEGRWFDNLVGALLDTLRSQWREGCDTATAGARSTWILELLDVRGWSHGYVAELGRGSSHARFRMVLVGLMAFRTDVPSEVRHAYWEWLDRSLLRHVRETQPELFAASIQDAANMITNIVAGLQGTADGTE